MQTHRREERRDEVERAVQDDRDVDLRAAAVALELVDRQRDEAPAAA